MYRLAVAGDPTAGPAGALQLGPALRARAEVDGGGVAAGGEERGGAGGEQPGSPWTRTTPRSLI